MIKLDWTIFLQAANFLVLMLVLHLLLYRPLRAVLARRRETIGGAQSRARELEEQINEKMSRYQARLQEAKLRGGQEKATLRTEAARQEAELLAAARGEAAESLQTIRNRVTAEAEQAGRALRGEVETLAAGIAAKVMGRSL